jgi:hypothetical protein
MDPSVVLALTWIFAGVVVAAYIWFVVWRFRIERRKKQAQAITEGTMSDAIARTAQRLSAAPAPSAAVASAPMTTPAAAVAAAIGQTAEPAVATVAGLLSGIALPHELVPLTTLTPRPAVGDRVAFWTDRAPADVVGPAFASELERLGYTVLAVDERSLSAQRDGDRLLVVIHPDGPKAVIGDQVAFSTVPEFAVVIEVWVPA